MKNVMKKLNKKGFTLAELLIVVAIIAVLVAISIPIFNSQLEKSRDAVDAANVRSAYAQAAADYLTETDGTAATYAYKIEGKSTDDKWSQNDSDKLEISGKEVTMVKDAKSVKVTFAADGTYDIVMDTAAITTEGKQP